MYVVGDLFQAVMQVVHVRVTWDLRVYPGVKDHLCAHRCTFNVAVHVHHIDLAFDQGMGNFFHNAKAVRAHNRQCDLRRG